MGCLEQCTILFYLMLVMVERWWGSFSGFVVYRCKNTRNKFSSTGVSVTSFASSTPDQSIDYIRTHPLIV